MKKLITRVLMVGVAFGLLTTAAFSQSDISKQAVDAYNKKDYPKSIELYKEALKADPLNATDWYNLGCCYALIGNKDDAFKALHKSIDNGWSNGSHIRSDSDLDILHSDPRWPLLLKHVDATEAEASYRSGSMRFWDGPSLRSPYKEGLSEDEKVAGLSKLWSEAKNYFAYFDKVPNLDWDGVYMEYLPRVRKAKSMFEYYTLLSEVAAKLKRGDTEIIPPPELMEKYQARPPIRVREIDGHAIIVGASDAAKAAGAAIGAEIVEVDSVPVAAYAQRNVIPHISASTPQQLNAEAFGDRLLEGTVNSKVALTLLLENGSKKTASFGRLSPTEWQNVAGQPPYEYRVLPGNVAYLAFRSFSPAYGFFRQKWAEIASADAMIIDAREAYGGFESHDILAQMFLNNLTTEVVPTYRSSWMLRTFQTRNSPGAGEQIGWSDAGYIGNPPTVLFDKPTALLVRGKTRDAGQFLTVSFDALSRGPIIGEPTSGSAGARGMTIHLPGGLQAQITVVRMVTSKGDFTAGSQPSRTAKQTVADFRAGRDPVIEAALQEIKAGK